MNKALKGPHKTNACLEAALKAFINEHLDIGEGILGAHISMDRAHTPYLSVFVDPYMYDHAVRQLPASIEGLAVKPALDPITMMDISRQYAVSARSPQEATRDVRRRHLAEPHKDAKVVDLSAFRH
ncbi:MAG: hypothetical protein J0H83_18680 [Candidatus Melainabacteria bacterium]|jgi:hypothetical protein|nr:hypothetical protein [Candidatus Melainabacteria bacterium]